jgi:hypothetical protein
MVGFESAVVAVGGEPVAASLRSAGATASAVEREAVWDEQPRESDQRRAEDVVVAVEHDGRMSVVLRFQSAAEWRRGGGEQAARGREAEKERRTRRRRDMTREG